MSVSPDVVEAARIVGASNDIEPAVLLAVAIVETNAVAFAPVGQDLRPLIRFEGHYFDRLLAGRSRESARASGLAHPRAGAVRNPASQGSRWALLARAAAIDEAAAYAATSWGLAQVMGSHWQALGYASPIELAAAARRSAEGQFDIAARFLRIGRLHRLLETGDPAGFARRYNGPAFARNRYDEKIAAALARARRILGTPPILRVGSRGPDVAALQRALASRGFTLAADALFGAATEAALRTFQTREALAPDGLAGPQTLSRLGLNPRAETGRNHGRGGQDA